MFDRIRIEKIVREAMIDHVALHHPGVFAGDRSKDLSIRAKEGGEGMKRTLKMKVVYDGPGNIRLDNALTKCMRKNGWSRWASGINMSTGERDLAFDKEVEK